MPCLVSNTTISFYYSLANILNYQTVDYSTEIDISTNDGLDYLNTSDIRRTTNNVSLFLLITNSSDDQMQYTQLINPHLI